MLEDKDTQNSVKDIGIMVKDTSVPISYTKTNKLVTALYMVTDIMDSNEPLRNKLRTLGIGIISDMHTTPSAACGKIAEIMSFLDIASAINIISEMNCSILRKEFAELDKAIKDSLNKTETIKTEVNLSEFLKEELPAPKRFQVIQKYSPIGHRNPATRIGVQKGGTLLKALSDKMLKGQVAGTALSDRFNIRKQRRDKILNIIKGLGGSATIKDIRDKMGAEASGATTSEKTIQRELMSMTREDVLNKTGEKRWTQYSLLAS